VLDIPCQPAAAKMALQNFYLSIYIPARQKLIAFIECNHISKKLR